jgi:hypothetical protein
MVQNETFVESVPTKEPASGDGSWNRNKKMKTCKRRRNIKNLHVGTHTKRNRKLANEQTQKDKKINNKKHMTAFARMQENEKYGTNI